MLVISSRRLTRPYGGWQDPRFCKTMYRCIDWSHVVCFKMGVEPCARRPRLASLLQALSSWCLWSFSEKVLMTSAYISFFSRNWRFFRGDILRSVVFLNFHPVIILQGRGCTVYKVAGSNSGLPDSPVLENLLGPCGYLSKPCKQRGGCGRLEPKEFTWVIAVKEDLC